MSGYGALLLQFLKYELRASREITMRRREHRLLTYMASETRDGRDQKLAGSMHHFLEASPETDRLEILDDDGRRLFPATDAGLPLPAPTLACAQPCLSLIWIDTHPVRVLTHHTILGGRPVWIIMGGMIDEHFDILNSVRAAYFVLLPLVLLGSVAGGYALSRRALLPVGRLTETAKGLSMTALNGRVPVPQTGDELQSLAEAWNDLLVRLEAEVNRSNQFTMDASHDLRTAVTVILANAQLSLRRERTPAEYRETLATILQEATHTLDLLEEMLLAAPSHGRSQVTKRPVSLDSIVLDVLEPLRASAVIKGLEIQVVTCQPVRVLGDGALLRRMTSTLLDNAMKYTPSGGIVSLALEQVGHGAVFRVRDTGIGIAPDHHARVFDRLFRVDAARSRLTEEGNGLGLSIAKWIAEVHGFTIEVASTLGHGATFSVVIPIRLTGNNSEGSTIEDLQDVLPRGTY